MDSFFALSITIQFQSYVESEKLFSKFMFVWTPHQLIIGLITQTTPEVDRNYQNIHDVPDIKQTPPEFSKSFQISHSH